MTQNFVVAIDGPAGSGKSSVSRALATILGFGYLDTGAAYRALAWHALQNGGELLLPDALFDSFDLQMSLDPLSPRVLVRDVDVTVAIRDHSVAERVSGIAKDPMVRAAMNAYFAGHVASERWPGLVIEGRDTTTNIAPNAPVRILLSARPDVRAARRAAEEPGSDAADVATRISARDASDSTVTEFFAPAPGVTLIDSSDLSLDEVVANLVAIVNESRGGRASTTT